MSDTATQTRDDLSGNAPAEGVTLTERAAAHIRRELAKQSDAVGLRIAVKTTGCSGLMYVVDFVSASEEEDLVFDAGEGLRVYVDPKSYRYIRGTEVDFVQDGLSRHLAFHNPNVTSECGCGESFSVS